MISKQLNHTVTLFSSMPKYHRIGVIILCGALISVGLSRKSTEDSNIPSSSSSILATTAHAASLQNNTAPLVEQAPLSPITEHTTDAITAVEQALQTQPKQSTQVFIEETVKDGDFLETVFKRAKVNSKYMYHLLHNHPKAKSLAKIYPGHKLLFVLDSDGKLAELHHIEDELHKQVFARTDDGYEHSTIALEPEVRLVRTSGTITHSLYAAAKEANLEDKLTMSLADIFGWDVDFALDIRENDSFVVVYEERYLADKYLGSGNIIAAEFVNRGKSIQAVRYVDSRGDAQYYTPEGRNMRKAFLRAPVDFRRISSNFNPRRLHPITKTVRPHRGIDYAASTGTPVWSPGDGKVLVSSYSKYNGNYIVIQHSNNVQTKYLHLHKRKVKKGQRVSQRQVIGTVGTTGLSTAPHLHYEFLLNGVHRNPRTIVSKLPKADPVPKAERERFFAQTQSLVAQLNPTPKATQVASQEQDAPPTTTAM
ncbi:peptidoglycan DD-metalloendopeptidase family protein [Marinagarivorans cellulosilyticus]|uniref:Peptidase M23 n=1 Tax=Marinagarivorans cellulosilyticus TaxID=2721545 RepID=A0AAN1WGR9_9GAMM|nr:peptidoglycan DD-metalloendopeptidase family protein [Marinagarivorans cellulosilyticus]BCD97289.1 hypothetical protein MARGE09_P1490 [Marinagarivorans cellulosilyticus]